MRAFAVAIGATLALAACGQGDNPATLAVGKEGTNTADPANAAGDPYDDPASRGPQTNTMNFTDTQGRRSSVELGDISLPAYAPKYPGSNVADDGKGGVMQSHRGKMTTIGLFTQDDPGTVTQFYRKSLEGGGLKTSVSVSGSDTLLSARNGDGSVSAMISVSAVGRASRINIVVIEK